MKATKPILTANYGDRTDFSQNNNNPAFQKHKIAHVYQKMTMCNSPEREIQFDKSIGQVAFEQGHGSHAMVSTKLAGNQLVP